jgi:hypothetical protein
LCLDLAAALYANSHSLDAMISVLKVHREKAAESMSAVAKTCKVELAI